MKKTRRIEVTAFRRQIVIHSADGPGTAAARPSVSGDDGTLELTRVDSDEGQASHHDATSTAQLALLVETLIGSEGHSLIATPAASKDLRLADSDGGVSLSSPDQNRNGDKPLARKA